MIRENALSFTYGSSATGGGSANSANAERNTGSNNGAEATMTAGTLRITKQEQLQSSSTSTSTSTSSLINIKSDFSEFPPLDLWDELLGASRTEALGAWGSEKDRHHPLLAIEVGVHSPEHCVRAGTMGFSTHCFEPSPASYKRVLEQPKTGVSAQPRHIRERIKVYNSAVGPETGQHIPFHATGGTGDHVGEFDMWNMKRRPDPTKQTEEEKQKRGKIIEAPTISMDDFIRNATVDNAAEERDRHRVSKNVYLLKVDTQGFELSIFDGMTESIAQHRIQYLIFEFWPRGMDLIGDTVDQCAGSKVLDMLTRAEYSLYALEMEGHPKAPLRRRHHSQESKNRPFGVTSSLTYCRFFFSLEERYPSDEYKFGYWSDFLAVAPGVQLPSRMKKRLTSLLEARRKKDQQRAQRLTSLVEARRKMEKQRARQKGRHRGGATQ